MLIWSTENLGEGKIGLCCLFSFFFGGGEGGGGAEPSN
jgi:hypothetical protein